MIPLATIVAIDIGGILGGAVITETVFEWNAMGRLFSDGLQTIDPNPVMAFFVVVAIFAVIANIVADLIYAVLDPRIRIAATEEVVDDAHPRPHDPRHVPGEAPVAPSTRRASSRRRSSGSARARSSAGGSSGTRAR